MVMSSSIGDIVVDGHPKSVRPPVVTFQPSMWTDTFTTFSMDPQVQEKYSKEIEALKKEVRIMLLTAIDKLVLIDTLERLGVAYHFKQEIEAQLQQIFSTSQDKEWDDYDLFTTSLQFRLLRHHRYHVSCSVFNKFKDEDNKFKETLKIDAKGLLSLYEATQLRIHGEDILEEAVPFSKNQLKDMFPKLESSLKDQVKRALEQSPYRGVPRIETNNYISIYEKDESKNVLILRLAKLDFNFVQNLYRQELYDLMRWWKEVDVMSKLTFSRDRLVECYLWAVAFHFEPQYSYVRKAIAKSTQMATIIDDAYDNYATLEEAELFTKILERWDVNEIDRLPNYMQVVYRFILNFYEEYEREAAKQGKSFAVPYAKESVKQLGRASLIELKWFLGRQMPSFKDHLSNTVYTSCIYIMFTSFIPWMESVAKETIDWLVTEPNKMVIATANMGRYLEDLGSHERENKGGEMLTAVDCYMKQYGVSKQEALENFVESVENGWKDVNAEWVGKTSISSDFFEVFLNYARAAEITYKNCEDGFTNPEKIIAPQIRALFVDPIIV